MTSAPTSNAARPPLHTSSGPAALGTFEFTTPALPAVRALELLDTYYQHGGRLLDTAPTYGPHPDGTFRAEQLIATWLRTTGVNDVHVITKTGLNPDRPHLGDLRPDTILDQARRSADILGTGFTLVLHRDDPNVPLGEIADATDQTVRSGYASALGASNWTTARLTQWAAHARTANLTVPHVTAPLWSLIPRARPVSEPWLVEADPPHLNHAAEQGMTITPYRTLAAGYLAAHHTGRHAEHHTTTYDTPTGQARRARLHQAAAMLRMTPHALALAYLRAAAPRVVPVIGPRTTTQLRQCMAGAATAGSVTPDLVAYLEARR
ncbi:aldo/keto reductase [Streptomyces californicus]|uniref:aldo/keto reductase n=1 Tax=Streptomyces californicus TaxID=67351 RepID=UPI0037214196